MLMSDWRVSVVSRSDCLKGAFPFKGLVCHSVNASHPFSSSSCYHQMCAGVSTRCVSTAAGWR